MFPRFRWLPIPYPFLVCVYILYMYIDRSPLDSVSSMVLGFCDPGTPPLLSEEGRGFVCTAVRLLSLKVIISPGWHGEPLSGTKAGGEMGVYMHLLIDLPGAGYILLALSGHTAHISNAILGVRPYQYIHYHAFKNHPRLLRQSYSARTQ